MIYLHATVLAFVILSAFGWSAASSALGEVVTGIVRSRLAPPGFVWVAGCRDISELLSSRQ